jgi:hypothetical protein
MGIFMCTLILGVASFALAGVPAPDNCEADMPNYAGGGALSLFNLPNGGGSAFTAAQMADGSEVDATIEVIIRDGNNAVIPQYPAEDLWLESVDGGMVACIGGATADFDTDANGVTSWATPLNAGGYSTANATVMIAGDALTGPGGLMALHFNSADITGDGVVNLTDVGNFAAIYFGPYDFAGDFFADGQLNLLDVGRLGLGNGASCP